MAPYRDEREPCVQPARAGTDIRLSIGSDARARSMAARSALNRAAKRAGTRPLPRDIDCRSASTPRSRPEVPQVHAFHLQLEAGEGVGLRSIADEIEPACADAASERRELRSIRRARHRLCRAARSRARSNCWYSGRGALAQQRVGHAGDALGRARRSDHYDNGHCWTWAGFCDALGPAPIAGYPVYTTMIPMAFAMPPSAVSSSSRNRVVAIVIVEHSSRQCRKCALLQRRSHASSDRYPDGASTAGRS